jgi:hypothetical protein
VAIDEDDEGCRDWTRTQFKASFKAVFFEVAIDTIRVGRRVVIHQYPDSENWDTEDLGRLAETVQVVGYVHGGTADTQSDALLRACSSPGFGTLVLPNRTPQLARNLTCDSTWTEDALGRFELQLEFVLKAGGVGALFSTVLLTGQVASSVDRAVAAVENVFSIAFDSVMRRFSPISAVPAIARDAAAVTIGMVADAVDAARKSITIADADAVAAVEYATRQMRANAIDLAYRGQRSSRVEAEIFVADQTNIENGFSGDLASTLALLEKAAADPAEFAGAMATLATFKPQTITSTIDTLSVRAKVALTAELAALVRRLALLRRTSALGRTEFPSRPEAVTARSDISVAYRDELETTDDAALQGALLGARNAVVTMITRTAAELPPTLSLTYSAATPAVVIAATLYNDASRAEELFMRNGARHGLFMPLELEAAKK